ncbi:MAG TPA: MFS transporter [Pseudonocardiaceae bacterium]|nr:MFS transporter [Pseudonocardiaceae bacterium]
MIDARHRNTALLVAGCFFMENLDGTIVTTAAPKIGESLHVAPTAIGLVITAYLLTLAVLIPVSGWLSRRFGTRLIFLSAIAIFTLASLGCAFSRDLTTLVVLRVVQGVGGAMMVPVGRTVVLSRTEKSDLMRVVSYIVWPGLISPVIAPVAGALITTYASWPWLFGINVPLGVVAFAVAWRLIEAEDHSAPPALDWGGLILTCTGLGGLTYAAHLIADTDSGWLPITLLAGCSIVLLVLASVHLLRAEHPLLTLSLLRVHTFRQSTTGSFLYWFTVAAGPFLLPLLFQNAFGWSAVKSGLIVLFIFVGNVGIKPTTTPMLNRFGFRTVLITATIGMTASMVALGCTTGGTPLVLIILLTLVSGIFRSIALTAYNTVALSDVPNERMREANTFAATTTQLASGLAVAVATIALRLGNLVTGTSGHAAYLVAFALIAVFASAATIQALRMDRSAGDAIRKIRVKTR